MTGHEPLPLALTMGEPAGIGGEVALKAWQSRAQEGTPTFFAIDDPMRLELLCRRIGIDVPIHTIEQPEDADAVFADALPVMVQPLAAGVTPGQPDPANAPAVIKSIERAVELVRNRQAGAVVTNPIHKAVLYDAGFRHPGHTEFLGALSGSTVQPVMMLASPELKVVPVTTHVSLAQAIAGLTKDLIVTVGTTVHRGLILDFDLAKPRLAVAALNPHAGESGSMGAEETEIIAPAVAELAAMGIDVRGPISADTLFHPAARQGADAVLCMYHDQALIPLKTINFERGVNITLGLPFVRTSPDHGTALGIAGTGVASPASLSAAMAVADALARNRDRVRGQDQVA